MNASILPCEAASKHSNGGTIWPPGKTSIRNRPPLISSTSRASCSAAPCSTSSAGVQVVDSRHWTLGWAMTCGASTTAAAPAAASAPPALTTNRRRSTVVTSFIRIDESEPGTRSSGHELMVGAFGDVVPWPHQRLELRVGGMDLACHGSPL